MQGGMVRALTSPSSLVSTETDGCYGEVAASGSLSIFLGFPFAAVYFGHVRAVAVVQAKMPVPARS